MLTKACWWAWEKITGRRYFATMDPGGVFIPETVLVGYIDRKGVVHIEKMWTV